MSVMTWSGICDGHMDLANVDHILTHLNALLRMRAKVRLVALYLNCSNCVDLISPPGVPGSKMFCMCQVCKGIISMRTKFEIHVTIV